MKTHHLSPEEHLRCNAILERDNEFARMLGVENDGDEEMLLLRAAISKMSTAPSSSGHGGHSQQRKQALRIFSESASGPSESDVAVGFVRRAN